MSEAKFELKDKELIELDREIFELNKFYSLASRSLSNFTNIYAVDEFSKNAKEIRDKLKKIKTSDDFEKIFIENSLYNLESQEVYLNYFSKGDINVEKMGKIVLGEIFLDIFQENIKKFDYKELWDFYLSYQEYVYKSIPVDDESLREEFKKILVELKKDFLEYSKKEYDLPEDYNFELVLGQPYSQETNFHPTNRRMEISPNVFFVFKDEGKIKINVTAVIQSLFHEILGHGRQEILSREMPLSMQDNSINTSLLSSHVHFEGISQLIEKESINFIEKFKEKYNIEEDYIKQRILNLKIGTSFNFQAFYKYLRLKKIEDNSFNVEKEFNKITNNKGLSILYDAKFNSSLDFVSDAVYPLGVFHLENIISDIKRKIGEKEFNKNKVDIDKALATGVFNFKTLPKFVDLYLKKKGILK